MAAPRLGSAPSMSRALVVVIVVVFLVVQIPTLLGPALRPVTVSLDDVTARLVGGQLVVAGNVTGSTYGAAAELRVAIAGLSWSSRPMAVYLYYDQRYPPLGAGFFMDGLVDHLGYELRARGLPSTITVLDAPGMAAFLRSNATGVLVLATTGLPDLVFSATTNLLTPWIRRGGTLVWIGELIGGFTVSQTDTELTWESPRNLQWSGELQIFGSPLVQEAFGPDATGGVASPLASTLGLQFSEIATGADTGLLAKMGGLDLGWMGTEILGTRPTRTYAKTSIAAVHVDNGTVLLFGYTVTGPGLSPDGLQGVTHDLAQILASGVLYTDYSLNDFAAVSVPIAGGASKTVPWRVTLPAGPVGVSVFAYVDPCAASDPSQCLVGVSGFAHGVLPVV